MNQDCVLYFSNNCCYCKDLLTTLNKNVKLRDRCKLISVDNGGAPPQIKSVPTLMVFNLPQPLIGENVFKWIDEQIKSQFTQQSPQQPQFQPPPNSIPPNFSQVQPPQKVDASPSANGVPKAWHGRQH